MQKTNLKRRKKASIERFISEDLPPSLDEEIRRFSGEIHRRHSNNIFGKKYKYVHDAMDRKSKQLGGYHRIYGHNVDFLKKTFTRDEEILVGYIHLLGDFMSDILSEIFKIVLKDINGKKINPPQFFIFNTGIRSWDIEEKASKEMIKKMGKVYTDTLKNKINRKVKSK